MVHAHPEMHNQAARNALSCLSPGRRGEDQGEGFLARSELSKGNPHPPPLPFKGRGDRRVSSKVNLRGRPN